MGTIGRWRFLTTVSSLPLLILGGLLAFFAPASAEDLFVEDFESYPVGTLPAIWEIVYSGKGPSWQIVTDLEAASGPKSLRLWGQPGWSAVVDRHFATDSPVLGYRFAMRIEPGGVTYAEHPAFFKLRAENYWGTYYAVSYFWHLSSEIQAEDGTVLGTWTPGGADARTALRWRCPELAPTTRTYSRRTSPR